MVLMRQADCWVESTLENLTQPLHSTKLLKTVYIFCHERCYYEVLGLFSPGMAFQNKQSHANDKVMLASFFDLLPFSNLQ